VPLKMTKEAVDVSLNQIEMSFQKWRTTTADQGIQELATSLKEKGQIHAISLLDRGNHKYEVIQGHRRTTAAPKAGLSKIRADLYRYEEADGEDLDTEIARFLYAANLSEPLVPLEKARMFDSIMREADLTIEQLANMFEDETVETISDVLELLSISDEALEVVENNPDRFTEAHLKVLAEYASSRKRAWRMKPEEQAKVAQEIAQQTDKTVVRDPRKFESRVRAVVNERRTEEREKRKEQKRKQADPVKVLLKSLENLDSAVAELVSIDLRSLKRIEAVDKGHVLNRCYTSIEQLTTFAEERIGKLPVRKAAA
jgi:ParB/RepB/Spo0J family partition protein